MHDVNVGRAPLRAIVENSCGLTWGFEIYHSLQQNCCDFAATSLERLRFRV